MMTLQTIAHALGGKVSGREVLAPTPGHSKSDRGTAVRLADGAPDGVLVTCYNGGQAEALAVKDALRAAGVLPSFDGRRRELTPTEREAIRRAEEERDREREERQIQAREAVHRCLHSAHPAASSHPYLVDKRIAPERLWHGVDCYGSHDALLVPMQDTAGIIWNVQSIVPGRAKAKLFAKSARTKGLFWWAGKAVDRLVIGEGMATVAAVRRATGLPVIAALTASNLVAVAQMVRASRPDLALTIAADDDRTGIEAARRAASLTGAALAIPEIAA